MTRDIVDARPLASGLFVITQVEGTTWLARSFRGGPLARIGAWSYSIYLFHWFVVTRLTQAIEAMRLVRDRVRVGDHGRRGELPVVRGPLEGRAAQGTRGSSRTIMNRDGADA